MEILESMFERVIVDSMDESKKIGKMTETEIGEQMIQVAENCNDQMKLGGVDEYIRPELMKLIRLIRQRKPGYVVADLKNIFALGMEEHEFNFTDKPEKMEPIINFSANEIFEKWVRVYGMKKHRHLRFDENRLYVTNRNEGLSLAHQFMKQGKSHFEDVADQSKFKSLSGLKTEKGAKHMKKNFPNIISLLKGDSKVGNPVEDLPVTDQIPPDSK